MTSIIRCMPPVLPAGLMFFVALAPLSASAQPADPSPKQTLPYDFSQAQALLLRELPNLRGHAAVIVKQDDTELFRFTAGDIGYDTKTHLASFTKTLSAAVILALRDQGFFDLNLRIGTALPLFQSSGLGDPTILDCFGMRHGIQTPSNYEISRLYTLAQSVNLIGLNGSYAFPPGTMLGYDGNGMQTVGRIAELRTGLSWHQLARTRLFDPCAMPGADYLEFDPNPAIAGGARSTATETLNFAQMVMQRGNFNTTPVLSRASIDQLFTNSTFNLPVFHTPFPPTHPLYPYGADPDYGFGTWILAQNPSTQHVEEIVGAGAWGSFIWMDRRRGLSAVLITDIPAGTQASLDAALGLFDIARRQTEQAQVLNLARSTGPGPLQLTWSPPPGASSVRVYGSDQPIRDIFNLDDAVLLAETSATSLVVPPFNAYAVTARFPSLENRALVPGSNSLTTPCLPVISAQPLNVDGCSGAGAAFHVGVAPAPDQRFQWRFAGVPIDADANPSARTPNLLLAVITPGDVGAYDCVISNACGSVISQPARLRACFGDFSCDGLVDDDDFVRFAQQYDVFACADPRMPYGCSADFNADGQVDDHDFVLFAFAYDRYACP